MDANASDKKSLRILLVEDNKINQMVASRLLEKMGHQVSVAENGKIALDWIAKNEADLILMDLQMPIMDGITAAKEIRKWEQAEQRSPIPIIAATANTSEQDQANAYGAGMNDFLSKPLRGEVIRQAIERQVQVA
ncbi:MAG: response regulator [Bacteroidota bacterium]